MKTKKKIKRVAGRVARKTRLLVGKARAKTKKAITLVKKEWKSEKPHRKEYEKELRNAVKEVTKDVVRMGSNVMNTIKNDIRKGGQKKN